MIRSRKAAKAVWYLGGLTSIIKWPHQTYAVSSPTQDVPRTRYPQGYRWSSITWLPFKLAALSERLDPAHWDHWALDHSGETVATHCDVCNGWVCVADLAV